MGGLPAQGGDAGGERVGKGLSFRQKDGIEGGVAKGGGGILERIECFAEDALGVAGSDVVGVFAETAEGAMPAEKGGPVAVERVEAVGDGGQRPEAVVAEGVEEGLEAEVDGGGRAALAKAGAGGRIGAVEECVEGAGVAQQRVAVVVWRRGSRGRGPGAANRRRRRRV